MSWLFGKSKAAVLLQKHEQLLAEYKSASDTRNTYLQQVNYLLNQMKGQRAFNYDLRTYMQEYYNKNPHGFTVINKKNQPCELIPWITYLVTNKKALLKYKELINLKEYEEAQFYAKKGLEQVDKTPMDFLFNDMVNEDQTWGQYVVANLTHYDVTGNAYTYKLKAAGLGYYTRLYNLPSQEVEIIIGDQYNPVTGYRLHNTPWGSRHFLPEEISHRKRLNTGCNISNRVEDILYGYSPFGALDRTMKRSNHSFDAAVSIYEQGRPAGILSTKGETMVTDEYKKEMRIAFDEQYGGGKNRGKWLFNEGGELVWVSVGSTPEELQMIQADERDLEIIANVFDLPIDLVSNDKAAYNNKVEAEKAGWQNCRIPGMTSLRDKTNKDIVATLNDVTGKEYWCDPDYSAVACLQEVKKDKSEVHIQELEAGIISRNEYLQLMERPTIPDPAMDLRIPAQRGISLNMNDKPKE